MFQFEDSEKRLEPLYQSEENLTLVEAKPTTPAEKVTKIYPNIYISLFI